MRTLLIAATVLALSGTLVWVYAEYNPCPPSAIVNCSLGCVTEIDAIWYACSTHEGTCCQYKYWHHICTGTPNPGLPPCFGETIQRKYLKRYPGAACDGETGYCPGFTPT